MSVRGLRRGSIAASRITAPATVTVLDLPGTSGNYASTPDSAATSITSDIDIRVKVALDNWVADQWLVSKYQGEGTRAYSFAVLSGSGALQLNLSADGSNVSSAQSSVATGFSAGTAHWVRATWRNSDNRTQFFKSEDGSSWNQLGTDRTINLAGIANTTAVLGVGYGVDVFNVAGNIYYAEVRDGIDGTVVAKYDPSGVVKLGTRNPTSFVSSTGETWTMNGSAWDWATA